MNDADALEGGVVEASLGALPSRHVGAGPHDSSAIHRGTRAHQLDAASERPTHGLDAVEVEQMVHHLAAVADTYDDRLVAEFGGKRASDA